MGCELACQGDEMMGTQCSSKFLHEHDVSTALGRRHRMQLPAGADRV